jgi:hypothetical protein
MSGWREAAIVSDGGQNVAPEITPFPTGRVPLGCFPGIPYLATLVSYLRDKDTLQESSSSAYIRVHLRLLCFSRSSAARNVQDAPKSVPRVAV